MNDKKNLFHCIKIRQYVCKYLKYIRFNKLLSSNTQNAYCIDLRQFLEKSVKYLHPFLSRKECFLFTNISQDQTFSVPHTVSYSVSMKILHQLLNQMIKDSLKGWLALSVASRNRKHSCLKAFLKWLYIKSLITMDLQNKVPIPSVPHRLPYYLSVDEVLLLN